MAHNTNDGLERPLLLSSFINDAEVGVTRSTKAGRPSRETLDSSVFSDSFDDRPDPTVVLNLDKIVTDMFDNLNKEDAVTAEDRHNREAIDALKSIKHNDPHEVASFLGQGRPVDQTLRRSSQMSRRSEPVSDLSTQIKQIRRGLVISKRKEGSNEYKTDSEVVEEAIGMLSHNSAFLGDYKSLFSGAEEGPGATEASVDGRTFEKANLIVYHISGRKILKDWLPLITTMNRFIFGTQALAEAPDRELFLGISAFGEKAEHIRPTVESVFKHGGYQTRRFHVVLVNDCLTHPLRDERINSQPFGVTWEREDKKVALTIINKGLRKYTAKFCSQHVFEIFKKSYRADAKRKFDRKFGQSCSLLTDTKIIFASNSIETLFQYLEEHDNVMAATGTQELFPTKAYDWNEAQKMAANRRMVDDVDIGIELQKLRPTWFGSIIGGQSMQAFEFLFSFALNSVPYHILGHLGILPGPCQFYNNDKIEKTKIFDEYSRTLQELGSERCVDHLLKLLILAEDRLLSCLYTSATKKDHTKVAWCAGARFYYKPEPSWHRLMWQRVRWQPGTLAGYWLTLLRPHTMKLVGKGWAVVYSFLCAIEVIKIFQCCISNFIYAILTEYSLDYDEADDDDETGYKMISPFPAYVLKFVIWANIIFPVVWCFWATLIATEVLDTYEDMNEINSKLKTVNFRRSFLKERERQPRKSRCKMIIECHLTTFMISISLAVSVLTICVTLTNFAYTYSEIGQMSSNDQLIQWGAITVFLGFPVLAWLYMGQVSKAFDIPISIVKNMFTNLLFFQHHFGHVPLFTITMCRCLKWRGRSIMASEKTSGFGSFFVKNLGVIMVVASLVGYCLSGSTCDEFEDDSENECVIPFRVHSVKIPKVGRIYGFKVDHNWMMGFLLFPQVVPVVVGLLAWIKKFLFDCFSGQQGQGRDRRSTVGHQSRLSRWSGRWTFASGRSSK